MHGEKHRLIIAFLLIIVAIILINVGIMNGDIESVEKKTTNVCLECIGIG